MEYEEQHPKAPPKRSAVYPNVEEYVALLSFFLFSLASFSMRACSLDCCLDWLRVWLVGWLVVFFIGIEGDLHLVVIVWV